MLFADPIAHDDYEFAVCGNFESGDLGELLRRDRYRVRCAMAFPIPHCLAQRRLLLIVGEIAALLLQLRNHLVED